MRTSFNWAPTTLTKVKGVYYKHDPHRFVVYPPQVGPSRQIWCYDTNVDVNFSKNKETIYAIIELPMLPIGPLYLILIRSGRGPT